MLKYIKEVGFKLLHDDITTPSLLKQTHFPGLDGLRGIAIIIVLLSHFFMGSAYSKSFAGDIGVEIFFVISGFLITALLLKEKVKNGSIDLRKFYLRRLLRIMPVAYLFLITLAMLNQFLKLNIPFRAFLSASLYFQNIPKISVNNWYVAHFWSLSVEEQFYLTFPFLMVANLNSYTKVTLFLVIFIPIISLLGYTKTGVFYTNPIVHAGTFVLVNLLSKTVCILIGCLFAIMMFKGFFIFKINGITRFLSLLLFVFAILIHTESSIFMIPHCGLLLFPLIIGIVIILNLNEASILTRILSNQIISYIGLISYSLYIWQQLFTSEQDRIFKHISPSQNILILFVVAIASYHLYEKPFIKLKNRFKSN